MNKKYEQVSFNLEIWQKMCSALVVDGENCVDAQDYFAVLYHEMCPVILVPKVAFADEIGRAICPLRFQSDPGIARALASNYDDVVGVRMLWGRHSIKTGQRSWLSKFKEEIRSYDDLSRRNWLIGIEARMEELPEFYVTTPEEASEVLIEWRQCVRGEIVCRYIVVSLVGAEEELVLYSDPVSIGRIGYAAKPLTVIAANCRQQAQEELECELEMISQHRSSKTDDSSKDSRTGEYPLSEWFRAVERRLAFAKQKWPLLARQRDFVEPSTCLKMDDNGSLLSFRFMGKPMKLNEKDLKEVEWFLNLLEFEASCICDFSQQREWCLSLLEDKVYDAGASSTGNQILFMRQPNGHHVRNFIFRRTSTEVRFCLSAYGLNIEQRVHGTYRAIKELHYIHYWEERDIQLALTDYLSQINLSWRYNLMLKLNGLI